MTLERYLGIIEMSDCCSPPSELCNKSKNHRCPVSGQEYKEVSIKTILHHINEPWSWNEKQQSYYFCEDPECEVVYFGQDDSVITAAELRTVVGIKDKTPNAMLCYCFGISFNNAAADPALKTFVTEKTKRDYAPVRVEILQASAA